MQTMRRSDAAAPSHHALCWAISIAALIGSGCTVSAAGPTHAFFIVFADVSASVPDQDAYRAAWGAIIDALEPGDRVLLAPISDRTYTAFQPLIDLELAAFDPWHDNRLRYAREREAEHEELRAAIDRLLALDRSPNTDVLNAVALAAKVFATDQRRPVLVLLSDMIEDSSDYDFDTMAVNRQFAERLVAQQTTAGDLPDLHGAAVYVAGASAATAKRAHAIEAFWKAYLTAAKGRIVWYGPALLGLEM